MIGHHESRLCIASHEEEDDERIRDGDYEGCQSVVEKRSLLSADMDILHRVATETVESEDEEQYATEYLQIEFILMIGDEIHNETHAETREQGIYYIAYGSTYACYETISASFVQGSLNTEHANWSHWGRYHYADEYALQQ